MLEGILVIDVEDTGTGIPKGVDVFQLFKTTKAGGTGLGLPIVQQIVSDHKGVIRFASQSDQGTTFQISLPLNPAPGIPRDDQ
jgi:signal transduction histidine kinase